eukprot:3309311-Rhodomonas_salina.1
MTLHVTQVSSPRKAGILGTYNDVALPLANVQPQRLSLGHSPPVATPLPAAAAIGPMILPDDSPGLLPPGHAYGVLIGPGVGTPVCRVTGLPEGDTEPECHSSSLSPCEGCALSCSEHTLTLERAGTVTPPRMQPRTPRQAHATSEQGCTWINHVSPRIRISEYGCT